MTAGRLATFAILSFLAALPAMDSLAQGKGNKGGGKGMKSEPSQSQQDLEALGQIHVGLVPDYPTKADCPQISSFFGSGVRYDGSSRMNDHYGFHNGIDISLSEGTPLLAVADGEIVHAGSAGMLVGNYVWMHHEPSDTGLSVHLFIRYQHMNEQSRLGIGTRIKVGDVVGVAGKTGTVGGYFGPSGYSHLHMLVFASNGADFTIREAVVVAEDNRRYLDPLAIFMKAPPPTLDNQALRDLPETQKHISIPFQTANGAREPEGTRMIWPVSCRAS